MLSDAEKIDLVRGGRAYYTWLMPLGIAKNTIAEIKEGNIPMTDTLVTALQRGENVSLSWLLEDKGPPFHVARFETDKDCFDETMMLLAEEPWEVCLVTDKHNRSALVLTMQSAFQRARGKFVEHTAMQVLGDAGPRAIAEAATNASVFKKTQISVKEMDELLAGKLGTYAILGDGKKKKGLLGDPEIVGMGERIDKYTFGFEDRAGYMVKDSDRLNKDERHIIDRYRQLSREDQELLSNIIKRLS